MKKVASLLLAIIMVLSMASVVYAWEDPIEFTATVITCRYIEATDKYSFCAVGDVYGNGNRDPFTFSIAKENIKIAEALSIHIDGGLRAGQVITIGFSGMVAESYPMQISPYYVVVEEETEEFADGELLNYLSMFYSEEWLIDNGYMEVPLAEGEEAPDNNTESFVPDYDTEEFDSLDNEYSYVYGTPKEGDDAGKCVMLTNHYLDGFIVVADIISNDVEGGKSYASIYFYAYSNFDTKAIAPVRIDFEEDSIGMMGLQFSELTEGMNLRIYCDYGAFCVPIEGERYYKIDGEVLTIEKLEGFTEDYDSYLKYFFDVSEVEVEVKTDTLYAEEIDDDAPNETDTPITEFDDETMGEDEAVCGTSDTKDSGMTVLWIAVCSGITVVAVVMTILLIKKK